MSVEETAAFDRSSPDYQANFVESARLQTISQLAAGVAHEINNPLLGILGLSEFLLKELEPGSPELERVQRIHEAGLEIKEVVHALLAVARERPDEPAPASGRSP